MRKEKTKVLGLCFFIGLILLAGNAIAQTSRIDLVLEDIHIQPSRPHTKANVTAVASIRNDGSETANELYIGVTVKKSDRVFRRIQDIPVLSRLPRSGSGFSLPINLGKYDEGNYIVEIEVDPDDLIKETDESNNKVSKDLFVGKPDYRMETY
ncbi:MAG: hypothetical protein JW893_01475 [Candidatus Omnitrophica bacterium]|nr:hypothetical protein [Candidatus Omnitrophota bacterium]